MVKDDNRRKNPAEDYNPHMLTGGTSHGEMIFYPSDTGAGCIVDGSLPPGYTADVGTDGRTQVGVHAFDNTQDEKAFINFICPNDYHSGMAVEVYFYLNSTTATNTISFGGTVLNHPADKTVAIDRTGTSMTAVTTTLGITTANLLMKDELDIAGVITPTPGDFMTMMIFRDVSGDDAAVDVNVVAYRVFWKRG